MEPKHVTVNTHYNKGSALFRCELLMEFDTPADASEQNDQITALRELLKNGDTARLKFQLWAAPK